MESLEPFARALVSLFAIVDPVGSTPIFLSLTSGLSAAERNALALRAAAAVFALLMGAALLGDAALRLFGIRVPSFQVGSGILLLLVAMDMWNVKPSRARHTPEEDLEAAEREDVAVVPLAIPLLAGPGAISTVILYAQGRPVGLGVPALTLLILLVSASCWVAFRLAGPLGRMLGQTGINILTRVMGLILAALAVEFIVGGLRGLFPALAAGA